MSKLMSNATDCKWETQKQINVPSVANFLDYSDIDVHGDKGPISRVAITSQEDAAVWIGEIDLEKFEFVGDGIVRPTASHLCIRELCTTISTSAK